MQDLSNDIFLYFSYSTYFALVQAVYGPNSPTLGDWMEDTEPQYRQYRAHTAPP